MPSLNRERSPAFSVVYFIEWNEQLKFKNHRYTCMISFAGMDQIKKSSGLGSLLGYPEAYRCCLTDQTSMQLVTRSTKVWIDTLGQLLEWWSVSIWYKSPTILKGIKVHCKNGIIIMTVCHSSCLMSEPIIITHMDTDDYMTIHHKGTSYFDLLHIWCVLFTQF